MRRSHCSNHRIFGLIAGFIAVMLAVPMAAMANGDYIPRGQPVPETIRYVRNTETGVLTRVSARMSQATMNGSTYHNFNLPVPASRLGQLGKAAIKRGLPIAGWGMVFKDLVNGAGWVIDELTQQVMDSPSIPQQQLPSGSYAWCRVIGGQQRCTSINTPESLCPLFLAEYGGDRCYSVLHPSSPNVVQLVLRADGAAWGLTRTLLSTATPDSGTGSSPSPVSDSNLGNLLKQSPQVVNAILIDPETGAPIRIPELVDALNDLRKQIEAANGLDPADDLVASDDYSATQPSQSEWPQFCDWATTVCDFIDWFKDDGPDVEKPEVPWEIENPTDIQQSWSSGLGGGSCPSPHQFSVTLGGYTANPEFSFEPICGFAGIMRPVIIAISTILAVMMVAGFRSTKDA